MIWFTLALFAVSFIAVALLAPKPEIEDARAQDLDPNSFPRATEDSPVPLVLGCVRQRAPNTLWYGGFRAEAQKERVKTGIFSSKKVTTGYKYYLTFDLGICLGPAAPCGPGIIPPGGGGGGGGGGFSYGQYEVNESGEIPLTLSGTSVVGSPTIIDLPELGPFDYVNSSWRISAFITVESTSDFPGFENINRVLKVVPRNNGTGLNWPEAIVDDPESDGNPSGIRSELAGGVSTLRLEYNVVDGSGGDFDDISVSMEITGGGLVDITILNTAYEIEGLVYGYSVLETTITVEGNDQNGGGLNLPSTWYPGTFDQPVDECIENLVGAGNVPAYRGTCHVVFCDAYIGETPQLRKIQFQPASYSTNLSDLYGGKMNPTSVDINPAEAIYEIITNSWRGLGIDPALVDKDGTFTDSWNVLREEDHGCSIIVSSPKTGKQVLTEILRQIDGILRQNDQGVIELVLIRDDYVVDDLQTFDEDDIISIENFTKTTWEDVRSQVKVSFSDRTKEESEGRVAIAQDMAVFGMIGRLSTANISFPFCYEPSLANRLAQRELNRLSVPLFRLTAVFNRNAYKLRAGDVIKINWTEYGFEDLVMRVQKADLGLLDKNQVRLELVQDIFAVADAVFGAPEESLFDGSVPVAEDITEYEVVEAPYNIAHNLSVFVEDGDNVPIILPTPATTSSTEFTARVGTTSGSLSIDDPAAVDYPPTGTFKTDYGKFEGFSTGLDATGFVLENVDGADWESSFSVAEIRGFAGLIYANGEWMAYRSASYDSGTNEVTLTNVYRALLGSKPEAHTAGDRVFSVNPEIFGDGTIGPLLSDGDDLFFKMVDVVDAVPLSDEDLTERNYTIQGIANLPVRPRNLTLESSRDTDQEVSSNSAALSWVSSNRAENSVTFEDDSSETPDNAETYEVEVWANGVQEVSLDETGITGNSTTVDLSSLSGVGEIRVYSRRTSDSTRSGEYAYIEFLLGNEILLSGDESGKILLSGDEQDSGRDGIIISGT